MVATPPTPGEEQGDDPPARDLGREDRDQTADDRDQTSEQFDRASEAGDDRADARDQRAERRDDAATRSDPGAAADRAGARRDRQGGASDRRHAEHDREAAATDRDLSARERAIFLVDELTGAHRRDAGILELEREITRARRTKHPFVLAFVDVDGLKATNDSQGHAAGDELLRDVIDTIRSHVRPYDLIVRFGGDEFLCGLADITLEEAAERFGSVNVDLASSRQSSVTAGLAELRAGDSLENLIQRADDAMYQVRQRRGAGR